MLGLCLDYIFPAEHPQQSLKVSGVHLRDDLLRILEAIDESGHVAMTDPSARGGMPRELAVRLTSWVAFAGYGLVLTVLALWVGSWRDVLISLLTTAAAAAFAVAIVKPALRGLELATTGDLVEETLRATTRSAETALARIEDALAGLGEDVRRLDFDTEGVREQIRGSLDDLADGDSEGTHVAALLNGVDGDLQAGKRVGAARDAWAREGGPTRRREAARPSCPT